MNTIPLVTIGITCFNAEDMISRAIESALGQTYTNVEIIVVDDASIDNSNNIINDIADKEDNVSVICHEVNKGAPSAYNSIILNAKGKYICFFDDDDFSHEDRLEKTVQLLESNDQQSLVCFCDRYVFHGSEKKIIKGLTLPQVFPDSLKEHMLDTLCYQYDRPFYRQNANQFSSLKKHNLAGSSAGTGIMTAPTKLLKKYLFDPQMHRFCDTELNLRLFNDGIGAVNIDEPLMTQHVTSGSDKTSFIEKESVYHALNKHKEIYRSYGIYYPKVFSIDEEFSIDFNVLDNQEASPLVTIGLCTENSAANIFEVVKSALSQTYSNIEIIIIDNASSDSTMDILSKINDSRLTVSRNKTKKPKAESLNHILSVAKGGFTVFFDDKDISLKHRIESQVTHLLNINSENPVFDLANYYDYIGGFSGVHKCFGSFGGNLDSKTLESIIWQIVIRHSESKYLLTDYDLPFFEYSLFIDLLCGDTKRLKELGFDPTCPDKLVGLDMLLRFSDIKGGLVTTRIPLVEKDHNPLRCDDWPSIVEHSNAFIRMHEDRFARTFNVDASSILHRNQLKAKLLRRFSRLKKYI